MSLNLKIFLGFPYRLPVSYQSWARGSPAVGVSTYHGYSCEFPHTQRYFRLDVEYPNAEGPGYGYPRGRCARMNETQANSTITLRLATRNDRRVAKAIYERKKINSLHALASAGLLDSLLVFMNNIGFMDALRKFNITCYRRMILPLVQFILTYMTKILLDIPSMNTLP